MYGQRVKRSILVLVLLVAGVQLAHAESTADVTQAFADFIAAVAKNKAPAVELSIPPGHDDRSGEDQPYHTPVPGDLAKTRAMIGSPKFKTAKVVVSKSGKSAWIAGEIAGNVERKGKQKAEPIRVSAFLVRSDAGWQVQATHWSTGEPDQPTEMCGNRDDWMPVVSVPKDAQTIVDNVFGTSRLTSALTDCEVPTAATSNSRPMPWRMWTCLGWTAAVQTGAQARTRCRTLRRGSHDPAVDARGHHHRADVRWLASPGVLMRADERWACQPEA